MSTGYNYTGARLASLVQTGANAVTFDYTYNPAGQIVSRTSSNDAYAYTGSYNVDRGYSANTLNQYTQTGSIAPSYDGRGNLTSAGSTTYGYGAENLLKSASGTATLYYDALNRLVEYDTSVSTRFAYDGGNIATEIQNGAIARRYVYGPGGDEPLVWYEGSGTGDRRYLHADERGSVIAVTDGNGHASAINSYDEYGIPGSGNSGRFQYTGQAWLSELGMQYSKARIYSPTLGRFMQTDPIGYGDGLNWYNYVGGDPVNFTDPSGLAVGTLPPPSTDGPDINVIACRPGLTLVYENDMYGKTRPVCKPLGTTNSGPLVHISHFGTAAVAPTGVVLRRLRCKRRRTIPIVNWPWLKMGTLPLRPPQDR